MIRGPVFKFHVLLHTVEFEPITHRLILYWPIAFGLVLSILRAAILGDFAVFALGLPGQIAFGLMLAVPLYFLRRTAARWLAHLLTLVVVLANAAAFHYEEVFGRLPGAAILYYLREARHLATSASANAPLPVIAIEVLLGTTLLVWIAERLRRDEASHRPQIAQAILATSVAIAAVVVLAPRFVPGAYVWMMRVPILWAAQSWNLQQARPSPDVPWSAKAEMIREWQQELGHRQPFGGIDPRYPLCGTGPRAPERRGNGRSVIFVILESVGLTQMSMQHEQQPVMPRLRQIAAANISFRNVKATGTKSLQALPALLAGIPPQPAHNLLWRAPLNNMEGLPRLVRRRGYRTAYFHGGDLSFEQQRPFVRMAGFETIVEFDLSGGLPFLGWGWSDDVVFEKMRGWIDQQRAQHASQPYLATLFTLSSHDPYLLPPDRKRVFPGTGSRADLIESLRFTDEHLGAFYDWYQKHEAPRGTLLVITGDHTPHLPSVNAADDFARFDVPLIIAGATNRSAVNRRGAHFDVPATIHGLLDTSPGACDQGLDLLAEEKDWLRGRTVYAVDGDQLEEFHVWYPEARVHLNAATGTSRVLPMSAAAERDQEAYAQRAVDLYGTARTISADLIARDAFAPPQQGIAAERGAPVSRVERPMFVAHRGQSRGAVAAQLQNKRRLIEQAIADGFEWIEVDVNLTRDGAAVVVHDDAYDMTLAQLRATPGMSDVMTLDEVFTLVGDRAGLLIEVKPQKTFYRNSVLALQAASIVRRRGRPGRVIMDSFSSFVAASLARHCGCPVGMDAPFGKPVEQGFLDNAALTGLQWIYVQHQQASPELIRDAHARGLRVLVYTVNDLAEIERLAPEWPDAIITDRAALRKSFEASRIAVK